MTACTQLWQTKERGQEEEKERERIKKESDCTNEVQGEQKKLKEHQMERGKQMNKGWNRKVDGLKEETRWSEEI